ncbi:mannose-6-phosphate isomerase [Morganella morganii]|uniref:mannose-6-phosphate isomerase n=1 Tax=Morganella morganii TaxID=582 RepID=UPI002367D349|nr:mannose-6-phosphate isomerase [Morganella morganii]
MLKMQNQVQFYDWGSHTAMTEMYGYPNPDKQPMAELWMGAHPKASSVVTDSCGNSCSLYDFIAGDPQSALGDKINRRFHRLPFLFKVLSAAQPLSVQVHPDKAAAEAGFARENDAGIPLDSPVRNYKDDNHKPELVYALTPFRAMNAFRPLADIAGLLSEVAPAHPAIGRFIASPSEENLSVLFTRLLSMSGETKERAIAVLKSALNSRQGEPWDTLRKMTEFYPDDNGLFTPLLLNVVELKPGEAMFLYARTPHAYLEGTALEVMANSDNVLRAGLTQKHIDVGELLNNLDFIPKHAKSLFMQPEYINNTEIFPIPVDDFSFSVMKLHNQEMILENNSANILFCVEGHAVITTETEQLRVISGESVFLSAIERKFKIDGEGIIARVYNAV